jgi:membrane protein DedA with SNARE-associated domain
MMDFLLDWLTGLPTAPTYLFLMLLSALENVFPPVPADTAVALGAFLAQRGEVSAVLIGVSCWAANMTTATAVYALARARGRAFFSSGWRAKLLPPEAIGALGDAYARHGIAGIFVTRFLPGLRAAVMPFAGIAGVPPLTALAPAAAASALWYAFLVGVGAAVGSSWQSARAAVEDANRTLAIAAGAASVLLLVYLWRLMRARRSGR